MSREKTAREEAEKLAAREKSAREGALAQAMKEMQARATAETALAAEQAPPPPRNAALEVACRNGGRPRSIVYGAKKSEQTPGGARNRCFIHSLASQECLL